MSQEEILKKLMDLDYNQHPSWVSINIGVFLCIRCAGLHRKMGTHISKVRSTNMDGLTSQQLFRLQSIGNKIANYIYEYNLPKDFRKLGQHDSVHEVEKFIRTKYQHKKWAKRKDQASTLSPTGEAISPTTGKVRTSTTNNIKRNNVQASPKGNGMNSNRRGGRSRPRRRGRGRRGGRGRGRRRRPPNNNNKSKKGSSREEVMINFESPEDENNNKNNQKEKADSAEEEEDDEFVLEDEYSEREKEEIPKTPFVEIQTPSLNKKNKNEKKNNGSSQQPQDDDNNKDGLLNFSEMEIVTRPLSPVVERSKKNKFLGDHLKAEDRKHFRIPSFEDLVGHIMDDI